MTDKEQILALRRELEEHNLNYYVKNAPTISDQEFDRKMALLMQLESLHPEMYDPNSPSQRVGSDLQEDFRQVEHLRPMLSLANTYNRGDVQAFYDRVSQGLGGEPFRICCELKFDGLSISITYRDGALVQAVTRGDGQKGDDVTANVKTIRSIPLRLKPGSWPEEFEVRGEVLMPWQSFDRLNAQREQEEEPLFANPRNAASGTLKSKSSRVVAQRGLDAYFYYLLGDTLPTQSHYENLREVASWGFKVSNAMRLADSIEDIMAFIDHWDTARSSLPVATDGIVLKVDSLTQQQRLGYTAKTPRWAIAYKFQPERALTRLDKVTWQVGRTGAVTPVANMEPVHLSGTIVKRASLHNEDIIRGLDLHIGDMVWVEKAGEIIPQVVGVDKSKRDPKTLGPKVEFIHTCPECGAPLIRYEGEAAHYCTNDATCPPQIKGKIEHFISRDAMNISSLGPETVALYFNKGLIRNAADLYSLTVDDLMGADGSKLRSAQKIVKAIHDSVNVPFERTLYALGIRFVGKVTARLLARHFRSLDNLISASLEQMLQVEGVGEVIASSIQHYFSEPKNMEIVERLKGYGVQFSINEDAAQPLSTALEGKAIVISGTFIHHSREEYKALIERHGGKNVSSISKKTSFILAGDNMGPSKLEKATSLGIPLVNEADFLNMIGEGQSETADSKDIASENKPPMPSLFD